MKKIPYYAPEAEYDSTLTQAMICDSLTGGIDDYELVDDYTWED